MRVVSYNIHSQRDDRDALASVVRGLAPDVLIVQEAPRRWRWRTRCAQLAHSFGLYYGSGGLPGLGNLILVGLRVRVTGAWCLRYPLTPGRHMRGAAFARCEVAGAAPFVVAGSHLSMWDGERPAQAGLLKPALESCREPVILGVDVNEVPGGPSWERLAAGLVDVAEATGHGGEFTFPVSAPGRRIDAILADSRLKIDRYEVAGAGPAARASDHFPVVADFLLPAADAPAEPRKAAKSSTRRRKPATESPAPG